MSRRAAVLWLCLGCLPFFLSCRQQLTGTEPDPLLRAYDVQQDWDEPDRLIPLDYSQAQGKRVFYEKCVWCHSDSTPAGPSNRFNLSPTPALINDGEVLNPMSDTYLQNIITLGGGAMGKSPLMPSWGGTLSQEHIQSLIAFIRAVAQPPYQAQGEPLPQETVTRVRAFAPEYDLFDEFNFPGFKMRHDLISLNPIQTGEIICEVSK
jgi:mono/diheme cytochrome c family protein